MISSNVFCADPTAVEYEGRLYVYGTNDHEQFLGSEKNTYEKIKSLVCFSTDDMVNWTYHGKINVAKIAPWIINSWAPSICSKKESDGLTHFYLYFSNNGCGTGVLTATSPLGPWQDPLKHPLVHDHMEGIGDCPNPFDPGVVIDKNGDGWLSFGAGIGKSGTKANPGSVRIVKLGKDMISFASDFIPIKAPYNYEASELNFINGTYVYTYNNNWEARDEWTENSRVPPLCSMAYMTSKTPLDSSSWKYEDYYLKNPGQMGFSDSNNHTHLHKFSGKWYLFYHTLSLQDKLGISGGFRSMHVDQIQVDEENVKFHEATATKNGAPAIKNLNPFEKIAGSTMNSSEEIAWADEENPEKIAAVSKKDGARIFVKNVDFANGASSITISAKGDGKISVEIAEENASEIAEKNQPDSSKSTTFSQIAEITPTKEFAPITVPLNKNITGVHDLCFVFSKKDIELCEWKLTK